MNCPKCGTPIPQGAAFCPVCNEPVSAYVQPGYMPGYAQGMPQGYPQPGPGAAMQPPAGGAQTMPPPVSGAQGMPPSAAQQPYMTVPSGLFCLPPTSLPRLLSSSGE